MLGKHTYPDCPNGCEGEVPTVWDDESQSAVIDDEDNAYSHGPGCPPLTDEQREAITDAATLTMSRPDFWFSD